jgi:hypothetical protein
MQEFKFTEEQKQAIAPVIAQVESSANMQTFIKMKEILNRIFGEENNQILKPSTENIEHLITRDGAQHWKDFTPRDTSISLKNTSYLEYKIVIRFPEVTIKNSKKQSIKIKDLFVLIPARPNGTLHGLLNGVTTTLTPEQYQCGYMHSHLRPFDTKSGPHITQFCLGRGEITMPLAVLSNKFDELNFQFLCHHLKNYVAWESIEGTPYNYMAGVIAKVVPARAALSTQDITRYLRKCQEFLHDTISIEDLIAAIKYEVTEKGIRILPTERLEKLLSTALPNAAKCLKDNTGEYYVYGTQRAIPRIPDRSIIYFKGNPVKVKIDGQEEENKKETYANPIITEQLCGWLSGSFTRTAITAQGTDWYKDSTDNIQQVANADPMALPAGQ